ncbi:hypothetical protein H0O02_02945 [Candidatus Micrarchaeota archaeon]|nr:hypothetical protein [Candidatus Micrarchaeota archaeon]
MRNATEAGDEEKAAGLREQIQENTPEGCRQPMHGKPGMSGEKIIESLPEEVQGEFKTAMENQDFEALKALKEEYFPEDFPGKMDGRFGGCNCTCETAG